MTEIVKYIQEKLYDENDSKVLALLTKYINTSHCYKKQNRDLTYLLVQPSFPGNSVISYATYDDTGYAGNHGTSRLLIKMNDGNCQSISLYKFKKFCKRL